MAASSWRPPRLPKTGPRLSRAGRAAGTLAAGAAAAGAAYFAAERALLETVPYGPDGGRQRGPVPLWVALLGGWAEQLGRKSLHASATLLALTGHPEVLHQLGRNALKPVPAGEVRVHWILPEDSERAAEDPLYQAPYRRAVEESMQAVVAALQQEAEAKGFGKHVLGHGFHLIVTPEELAGAQASFCDAVIMPIGMVRACTVITSRGGNDDHPAAMAALQYILAHELAHIFLSHSDERRLHAATLAGLQMHARWTANVSANLPWRRHAPEETQPAGLSPQQFASKTKALSWQHEFEADEVACALLARLRLPPEDISIALRVLGACVVMENAAELKQLQAMKQLLSPAAQQQLAADQGFPGGSFQAGLRLYKAAMRTGDPDAIEELLTSFHANKAQRRLQLQLREAANQGQSSLHEDDGLADIGSINGFACPASAVHTIFADLEQTHPPYYARLAHLRHVSSQQSMLVRAAAPPVAVGGQYSHVSVAKAGGRAAGGSPGGESGQESSTEQGHY